jgi:xanthine dehydrogenase accessory factor
MNDLEIFEKIPDLIKMNKGFVISTLIETTGSTPGRPGFKMLTLENGETIGNLGGGKLEKKITEISHSLLESNKKSKKLEIDLNEIGMDCGGKAVVWMEVYRPKRKLYIFGAGHVGKSLSKIAGILGFHRIIIDDRKEITDDRAFSGAEIVNLDSVKAAKELNLKDQIVVLVNRTHELDFETLKVLLEKKEMPFYLGMIGSDRKVKLFFKDLEKTVPKDKIQKVHAPIGIQIRSETPEEIAVSILAEIIRELKEKN